MRVLGLVLVRAYQLLVSPVLGPTCRFEPTCSVYTYQAIDRYGLVKGGLLGLRRVLRCHPFADGGPDPVP